jgi:predicted O-linked N-acetylglucosamine transferase (SPINDLY family)
MGGKFPSLVPLSVGPDTDLRVGHRGGERLAACTIARPVPPVAAPNRDARRRAPCRFSAHRRVAKRSSIPRRHRHRVRALLMSRTASPARARPPATAPARPPVRPILLPARRAQALAAAAAGDWARAAAGLAPSAGTNDPDAAFVLATALYHLGRHDDAAAVAARLLDADPAHARVAHLLTLARLAQHRFADALAVFERFREGPARAHVDFVLNHGAALSALGRPQEALAVYLEAAALDIANPTVHMRLGIVLKELKLFRESAEAFLTALTLDPGRTAARLMVLHMRQFACAWEGFEADREALVKALAHDDGVDARGEGAVWALTAIAHPPALMRRATAAVATRLQRGVAPLPARPVTAADRPLRIGYLSADFHNHATALLMVQALESRDRARFPVTLYSHSPDDGSPQQTRIRAACERFVDVSALSDRAAAERIAADGIDVLVDLKGHTFRNRLGILAHRPAPIQVTWLGFPGTTGATFVDYLIGDPQVTPLSHAAHYAEAIAQLPGSYQPNDGLRERPAPSTRARCGLPEDALVLGCFNQAFKIAPDNFALWMRVLRAVPQACLWLLWDNGQASDNLRRAAAGHGVDPARLVFAPRLAVHDHLARLPLADLMVDNWPCNAHTTASDALWMGVPLATRRGETFASRVAASLLEAVGLPELVCDDDAGYEALVVALLHDRARLTALREHLDSGRHRFPLFDGARFAAGLERLYARMAERARAGLPPAPLAAEPPDGEQALR